MVFSMSSSLWTPETKFVSNWDGCQVDALVPACGQEVAPEGFLVTGFGCGIVGDRDGAEEDAEHGAGPMDLTAAPASSAAALRPSVRIFVLAQAFST